VRQTKLASSLVNFRAHYNIVGLFFKRIATFLLLMSQLRDVAGIVSPFCMYFCSVCEFYILQYFVYFILYHGDRTRLQVIVCF